MNLHYSDPQSPDGWLITPVRAVRGRSRPSYIKDGKQQLTLLIDAMQELGGQLRLGNACMIRWRGKQRYDRYVSLFVVRVARVMYSYISTAAARVSRVRRLFSFKGLFSL
jgi:hypothetical protein